MPPWLSSVVCVGMMMNSFFLFLVVVIVKVVLLSIVLNLIFMCGVDAMDLFMMIISIFLFEAEFQNCAIYAVGKCTYVQYVDIDEQAVDSSR